MKTGSVPVPSLGVHASPLRYLDYLLVNTARAPVLTGTGVLARVPAPERYALHKLIVSQKRPKDASGRAKSLKDRQQAAALLGVLLVDAPEDLTEAWQDLVSRGTKGWELPARRTLKAMDKDLVETFSEMITG